MSPSSRYFARVLSIGLALAGIVLLVVGTTWLLSTDAATADAEVKRWALGRTAGTADATRADATRTEAIADLTVALFVVLPLLGYVGLAWGFARERRLPHCTLALAQIALLAVLGLPVLWTLVLRLL